VLEQVVDRRQLMLPLKQLLHENTLRVRARACQLAPGEKTRVRTL
jgi:hypothetical protein